MATGANDGEVIQVKTATDSTERSTTSTSYVTASNTLSVAITPAAAANKILILVDAAVYTSGNGAKLTVFRGATDLATNAAGFKPIETYDHLGSCFLDSPNTTSSITYQVYGKCDAGGTLLINRSGATSSITVLEVKG